MSHNSDIPTENWEKEEWGAWKIVSDMLDHPDENGIYPTGKAYQALYDFVVSQKEKARSEEREACAREAEESKIQANYPTQDVRNFIRSEIEQTRAEEREKCKWAVKQDLEAQQEIDAEQCMGNVDAAIQNEREECAKVAEGYNHQENILPGTETAKRIADALRARGLDLLFNPDKWKIY